MVRGAIPELMVLGSMRKKAEQASKHCPSMASASRFQFCLSSRPSFLQ